MIARKLIRWLAGLGLISGSAVAQTPPGHVPSAQAPAAWVAYAGQLNAQLQAWMADGSAPAAAVQGDLQALQPSGEEGATASLVLKVWVDAGGAITRLQTDAATSASLDADLAALVAGRRLAAPPPAGLLLPIRLKLMIKPPAAGAP